MNGLNNEFFLVHKLRILLFNVEFLQIHDQFFFVLNKGIDDGVRFSRICHEHFENMKCLKLNIFALVDK